MRAFLESPDDPSHGFEFECEATWTVEMKPYSDMIYLTRSQADAFAETFNRVMHPAGDADIHYDAEHDRYVYDLHDGLNEFFFEQHRNGVYEFHGFYTREVRA